MAIVVWSWRSYVDNVEGAWLKKGTSLTLDMQGRKGVWEEELKGAMLGVWHRVKGRARVVLVKVRIRVGFALLHLVLRVRK